MLDDKFKEVKGTDKVVLKDSDDGPAQIDGLAVVDATDTLAKPEYFI